MYVSHIAAEDRWLLAWAACYAAIGAASLLVPLYAITLGAGPFLVGLIAATAALAGVPGALIWGRLAERTGNYRTFLLVSLGLTTVSLAIVPLIPHLDLVLVGIGFTLAYSLYRQPAQTTPGVADELV